MPVKTYRWDRAAQKVVPAEELETITATVTSKRSDLTFPAILTRVGKNERINIVDEDGNEVR